MNPSEVALFDSELAAMLAGKKLEEFEVLHQIILTVLRRRN